MKSVLIILVVCSILVVPAALAQSGSDNPGSNLPGAIPLFSSTLIAWTDMQTPEPVPDGSPHVKQPVPEPQPETQPNDPKATPSSPASTMTEGDRGQTSSPAAQTFTGVVGKESDSYVLKISDTTSYKLDDQDQAKQYDGQRVRILGMLDEGSAVIHVQKIQPLS